MRVNHFEMYIDVHIGLRGELHQLIVQVGVHGSLQTTCQHNVDFTVCLQNK